MTAVLWDDGLARSVVTVHEKVKVNLILRATKQKPTQVGFFNPLILKSVVSLFRHSKVNIPEQLPEDHH